MERIEFCDLMVKAKENSGISTSDLSFAIKMQWATLRRFEKGIHNFNMKKAIEYLDILNAKICLIKNKKKHVIANYTQLLQWCIESRTGIYTQRTLAEAIGCSYVNMAKIETEKSTMSVDIFLKIAEVLDFNIEIKQ